MICSRCGKELAEWIFGEGEAYCQMCWEAHCSEEWWRLNVWQNGVIPTLIPQHKLWHTTGSISRRFENV